MAVDYKKQGKANRRKGTSKKYCKANRDTEGITIPVLKRFWNKVILPEDLNECWKWNASKRTGYGLFWWHGHIDAHRFSYLFFYNKLPPWSEGELDHLCRNPECVNPFHLEFVTHKENVNRGFKVTPLYCPKGHRHTGYKKKRKGKEVLICKECVKEYNKYYNKNLLTKEQRDGYRSREREAKKKRKSE